jgi:hypothetical protein
MGRLRACWGGAWGGKRGALIGMAAYTVFIWLCYNLRIG